MFPYVSMLAHNTVRNKESEVEINPFDSRDYFEVSRLFTVKDLFNARVHLGHTVRSMTTQMRPFIHGTRFDTCIFDLDETSLLLRQALNFMAHIAHRGGIILFIGRQPQIAHMVERTAIECGEYAHCRQWNTMAFTASHQVRLIYDQLHIYVTVKALINIPLFYD